MENETINPVIWTAENHVWRGVCVRGSVCGSGSGEGYLLNRRENGSETSIQIWFPAQNLCSEATLFRIQNKKSLPTTKSTELQYNISQLTSPDCK